MFRSFFLWVLSVGSTLYSFASSVDTIKLQPSFAKIDIIESGVALSSSSDWSPTQAWRELQKEPVGAAHVYVGFTDDIWWVGFTAQNLAAQELETVLVVDNPQIDWLSVFEIGATGQAKTISETGDGFLFSQRVINNRNFLFPITLNPGETKTIVLKLDKRNSSIALPVFLWNETDLNERIYAENIGFGLFFGFLLLCFLYAVLVFAFLRKAVYGWYALWIVGTGLYLSTALGFSFQYLYPNVVGFNSYFRIYLEVALFLFLVKFTQAFLDLSRYEPRLHRGLNYILYFFGSLVFLSALALDFFTRNGVWIIPIVNATLIGGGLLIFLGAIKTFTRQRVTVVFYFAAFGFLMISYMAVNLSEFGVVSLQEIPVNPVLIGSSLEIFIFSIALTYQMKNIYEERNRLSISLARQQKDLLKAYVEGVEKERERISRELHDDIGSRLGSLKRFFSAPNDNQVIQNQIDILCEDVRTMSHQLSPAALKIAGLRQMILDLAMETEESASVQVNVQFYDLPDVLPDEISHHLYRIVQESISNVVKHAQATEVDIQFFNHHGELVITLDDNGKGFDPRKISRGIGLKNIKARVESLNGSFELSSNAGQGTSILIKEIFIQPLQ
jgi:signal transduction histidine kinase